MVRLTDRPDMTLDVYRGRKTTTQQQLTSVFFQADTCISVSDLNLTTIVGEGANFIM